MTTTAANPNRIAQKNLAPAHGLKTTSAANQDAESPQPQKQMNHDSLAQECPPTLCQPVMHNALQSGLEQPRGQALATRPAIQATEPHTVGPNEYVTTGGTHIATRTNNTYPPRTTMRRVVPHDRALLIYLEKVDAGDAENVENMHRGLVKQHVLAYANNPKSAPVLERLGISDIRNLSPRQAMILCAQIAQDNNVYNDAAVERKNGPAGSYTSKARAVQKHMDDLPLQNFFNKSENGVCRNYAEMVQGLFMVLKAMQNPTSNQLVNTYVKLPESQTHMWNAFYTIEPTGNVMVSQVDATWNDPGAGQHGQSEGDDYTFGRNGVRDYYRLRHLLEGTGNIPLERFERHLDQGMDIGIYQFAGDGQITPWEVRQHGGIAVLNQKIEKLPEPLRVDAYAMLSPTVRNQLNVWRQTQGWPKLRTEHPQHN